MMQSRASHLFLQIQSFLLARLVLMSLTFTMLCSPPVFGQNSLGSSSATPDQTSTQDQEEPKVSVKNLPVDFIHDQAAIWTSPLKLRPKDLYWVVPSGI